MRTTPLRSAPRKRASSRRRWRSAAAPRSACATRSASRSVPRNGASPKRRRAFVRSSRRSGIPEDEPLPDPASIALDDEPDEKEKTSTVAALQRLRRRLIALEPVNPLAATELAEIGQRHEFLSTQKADLERAMTDLRSLADDLA